MVHDQVAKDAQVQKTENVSYTHETIVAEQQRKGRKNCRRVTFHNDLTTNVLEFPRIDPEEKDSMFYNKVDFQKFQLEEQRRHDRMMMNRIQNMVQEVMADKIEEALGKGATPEEIEAMMPQTPEEIFVLLGSQPGVLDTLFAPKPINLPKDDTILRSTAQQRQNSIELSTKESVGENEVPQVEETKDISSNFDYHKPEPRPQLNEEISDDELLAMLGVEDAFKGTQDKETALKEEEDTTRKEKESSKATDRPENQCIVTYSDDELYEMLGIEKGEEKELLGEIKTEEGRDAKAESKKDETLIPTTVPSEIANGNKSISVEALQYARVERQSEVFPSDEIIPIFGIINDIFFWFYYVVGRIICFLTRSRLK